MNKNNVAYISGTSFGCLVTSFFISVDINPDPEEPTQPPSIPEGPHPTCGANFCPVRAVPSVIYIDIISTFHPYLSHSHGSTGESEIDYDFLSLIGYSSRNDTNGMDTQQNVSGLTAFMAYTKNYISSFKSKPIVYDLLKTISGSTSSITPLTPAVLRTPDPEEIYLMVGIHVLFTVVSLFIIILFIDPLPKLKYVDSQVGAELILIAPLLIQLGCKFVLHYCLITVLSYITL